jgi:hypothetical protein
MAGVNETTIKAEQQKVPVQAKQCERPSRYHQYLVKHGWRDVVAVHFRDQLVVELEAGIKRLHLAGRVTQVKMNLNEQQESRDRQ